MLTRTAILFVALAAILGFALGGSFVWSLQPPPQGEHSQSSEASSGQTSAENREKAQPLWMPTDSVGLYTLVLAVFTGALVIVSGIQGYFLLRADKTARIAAEAASRNAKAAVGVELPILIFGDPTFCGSSRPGLTTSIGFDQKVPPYRYCKIGEMRVGNGGRTPAFPSEIGLGFTIGSILLPAPVYTWTRPCSASDSIRPDKTFNFDCWAFDIEMNDERRALLSAGATLWVYARILYSDFLGESHEHRVIWVWGSYNGRSFALRKPANAPAEYTRKS